jgi:hypothetical protein
MRLASNGTLRLSPTDLANHLACAHLTQRELRVLRGELERPEVANPRPTSFGARGRSTWALSICTQCPE